MVSRKISEKLIVVFHGLEPSEAVISRASQLLMRLLRHFPSIMSGAMTVEDRHRHHHQGNIYHVSLRLHLPGGDVVVSHDPELDHAHEDIYVAMRDSCNAAKRQLEYLRATNQGVGLRHIQARFQGNPRNWTE